MLFRSFDIYELLNTSNAKKIYDQASDLLQQPQFSTQGLIQKMKVRVICTTDDPIDSLEFHQKIAASNFPVKVYPAFRPDKAMELSNAANFVTYIQNLEKASKVSISSFDDYLNALQNRHDFFASNGCNVSDHGLEEIYAEDFTNAEINSIFNKVIAGKDISVFEQRQFKSCMLLHFAQWDWEKGWIQQFHLGALRNNNSRMLKLLGPDTGWDSIDRKSTRLNSSHT